MEPITPKTPTPPQPTDWTATGFRTALVSGLFTLVVLGLMVFNHIQAQAVNPLDHPEMARLKAAISKTPKDENLKSQLRALDFELRRKHYRHVVLGNYGAWLLLGGMTVFLISIKPATNRKKLPKPQKLSAAEYARENAQTSYAVGAFAVVTAGALLAISNNGTTFLTSAMAKAQTPAGVGTPTASTAPAAAPASFPTMAELQKNWPRFRGPFGSGVATYTNIPVSWDVTNGNNILWKSDVPLSSPSSPIVWGDRIFLSGADATNRQVYCYDSSGKLLWTRKVDPKRASAELPSVMDDGGFGPSTPCTDGQRVYAIFANGDVAAFDFAGNPVWSKNMGHLENMYGHATSLEMYQNRLIVQLDQATAKDNKSKIFALDAATGQNVWETLPRPVPNSWATPIVFNTGKRDMLVALGNPWVMGYDPSSGKEIWRVKAMSGEVLPSPVYSDGLVYTAIEGEKLNAIKVDGEGDVTATHVAWSADDGLPDIVGPLCDGPRVYLTTSAGTLTCFDAKTGKKLWYKDLDVTVKASTTVAGDKLFVFSDSGIGIIVQAGNEFKEIARIGMGEEVFSTPAFADGRMYVRTKKTLFCISSQPK